MINVMDYGAAGDGITDDTQPILDAYTAACALPEGDVLYLPANSYRTTSPININTWRVSVRGDGPQLTWIKPDIAASGTAFTFGWNPSAEPNWKRGPFNALSDLTIEAPIGSSHGNLITVDSQSPTGSAHSMTIRNVCLVGGSVQVDLNNYVYIMEFDRVFFHKPDVVAVRMDNPNTSGENIGFSGCNFSGGTLGAYLNKSGSAFCFTRCSFDYLTRAIHQRAGSMTFNQCHFETGAAQGAPGLEYLLVDRRGYTNLPNTSLTDCDIYTTPSTYDTFIRLKGDYGTQGLRITNPYIGVAQFMSPYLVRDDGPSKSSVVVSGAWYNRTDYPAPKFRSQLGVDTLVPAATYNVLQ